LPADITTSLPAKLLPSAKVSLWTLISLLLLLDSSDLRDELVVVWTDCVACPASMSKRL
jgi:hypothetical protein